MSSSGEVIELAAFGKNARKLARTTTSTLLKADRTYYLCSNNEHCLDELFKIRKLNEKGLVDWKIGITGTFPPIHKKYDFVYLERSMDCPEVRSMIKCPIIQKNEAKVVVGLNVN